MCLPNDLCKNLFCLVLRSMFVHANQLPYSIQFTEFSSEFPSNPTEKFSIPKEEFVLNKLCLGSHYAIRPIQFLLKGVKFCEIQIGLYFNVNEIHPGTTPRFFEVKKAFRCPSSKLYYCKKRSAKNVTVTEDLAKSGSSTVERMI